MMNAVTICNLALGHVGAKGSISGFYPTDRSEEARRCTTFYEKAKRNCLGAYDWTFARRRFILAVSAESPPDEWQFRYAFPNCLRVRYLVNPLGLNNMPFRDVNNPSIGAVNPVPFTTELNSAGTAKTILTSLQDAQAVCTVDVTDANLFSDTFSDALSHLLASYVAFPLTGKRDVKNDEVAAYQTSMRLAQAEDANEQGQLPAPEAPWIAGRN